MSKFIDLTGKRFERLVVLKRMNNEKHGSLTWLCLCDCGKEKVVRGSHIKSGRIKSCGCFAKDINSRIHAEHGHNRKGQRTGTYKSWRWMRQRCLDPKNNRYKDCGNRGITVCSRWLNSFVNFLKDMGERPDGRSLDRIKNNEDYNKGNSRWATPKEQNRNSRRNHLITHNGKTQCIQAWAEEVDISNGTLSARLQHGWSPERALITPVRKKGKK